MQTIKKSLFFISLITILLIVLEFFARQLYKKKNLEDENINQFVFYDQRITYGKNKEWKFKFATKEKTHFVASPTTNNLGFFSNRNYYPNENNFNIVVIGGEQTASSTVTVSWPDYLEDFINNKKVRVYNIGWPDAGPVEYIKYWKENFKILKPDLVLINFTYTDFYRGTPSDRQALLKFQGREINGSFTHQYKFDKGNAEMSVSIFPGSKNYKTIDRNGN